MKPSKSFFITFIVLNITGISIFVLVLLNNRSLSDSLKTFQTDNASVKSRIDSIQSSVKETDKEIKLALDENLRYKKIKANSFPEFAKNYLNNIFNSNTFFIDNSESLIMTSSMDDINYVLPGNEYSSILYYKNKKYRVSKNIIYLYDINYEYDDKGSELGMQLHFKKNTDGNWKLFKILYEGC